MSETAGYGGTLTLGGTAIPITVYVRRDRGKRVDRTTLGDYREKVGPGRMEARSGSFTVRAGTEAAAIRTHMNPANLAAAVARTLAMVWTDQASVTQSATIMIEDVEETHDGEQALLVCQWVEVG